MSDKIQPKRAVESDDYQGHNNDGEDSVTGKNREIDRPRQTGTLKAGCTVIEVISKV